MAVGRLKIQNWIVFKGKTLRTPDISSSKTFLLQGILIQKKFYENQFRVSTEIHGHTYKVGVERIWPCGVLNFDIYYIF